MFQVKTQVREWLRTGRFDAIVDYAAVHRRVLSTLTTLTYDADPLVAWRAIDAIGRCAGRVAETDPEFVREHLRRLFWLVTDESGGIAWRAPEAIGEIIRSHPSRLASFVPPLLSLFALEIEDLGRFLAGVLRAVGRVGEVLPEAVVPAHIPVIAALRWPDSQVRGLAVWCARQLGLFVPRSELRALLEDQGAVEMYVDGHLISTTVDQLAAGWREAAPVAEGAVHAAGRP